MSSKLEDPMTNVVIPLTPTELLEFRDWVHSIDDNSKSYKLLLEVVEETLLAKLEGRKPNKYVVLENDLKLDVSKFEKMVFDRPLVPHVKSIPLEFEVTITDNTK